MKTLVTVLLLIALGITSNAQNLNGKWKGKMTGPNGDLDLLYNFNVHADSLIGDVTSVMGTLPLENGKVNGNEFSFTVNVNGQVFSDNGVLEGDIIKLSSPMRDEPMILNRVNEESKIDGKWIGKVAGPQGEFEITFTFKVDGDKLTGKNSSTMGENELTNGVVNGNEFSFDVDAGGMIISHKCKYLDDDTIDANVKVMDQDIVMKLTRITQ